MRLTNTLATLDGRRSGSGSGRAPAWAKFDKRFMLPVLTWASELASSSRRVDDRRAEAPSDDDSDGRH
jgi:hypothetical protein